jgi:hypothetical protein
VGKPVSVLPVLTANAYWFDLFIDKSSDWRVPQEGLAGGLKGL